MFKVGQKVVCKNVDGVHNFVPTGIEKGRIYTIEAISNCACGKEMLTLKEAPKLERWCATKDEYIGYCSSFYSYRFEPLIDNWVEELLMRLKTEVKLEEAESLLTVK